MKKNNKETKTKKYESKQTEEQKMKTEMINNIADCISDYRDQ
jgi:hypothetical protein